MKYKVKALNVGDINGKVRYHGEVVDAVCFQNAEALVADGHLEPVGSEPEGNYPEVDPPVVVSINGDSEGFTQNGNEVTLDKPLQEGKKSKKNGPAGPDKK